jgi:hypothetical protein
MIVRLFSGALAMVCLGVLCGCSSFGGGTPAGQAQVIVTNVIQPEIEAKAEEVFFRHGFQFRGSGPDHMEFERKGGFTDNLLYGNWEGQDTTTRVTLFIIPKGATTYALRTRSIVERNTFGGDEDTKLFDIQGGRYKAILNKIAKELREERATSQG